MELNRLKQKILLIIIGLCIAFLLGEVFFQIGNLLVNRTNNNLSVSKSDNYRILCLGDSSTYGIGASDIKRFSYPSWLQTVLDQNISYKKFEVLNLGVPGINSSQLLNRFKHNILNYKPDMVIVMVGINDPWNFEESNILEFYNTTAVKQLYMKIELLLNKSKLFQFLKLVFLTEKFNELEIPAFDSKTLKKAVEFYGNDQAKAEAYRKAIISNITKLNQIADQNNVIIVFMKYHNIGWGRPELIIHHTYDQLRVPVVDNENLFKKAIQLKMSVFGYDKWHHSDLGYSLIAKNIFNKMIDLKIIYSEPLNIFE